MRIKAPLSGGLQLYHWALAGILCGELMYKLVNMCVLIATTCDNAPELAQQEVGRRSGGQGCMVNCC